ncbi:MAG: molybdopterin-dependent oxidoreductase [Deltaproteobacteria bacterium]|nr:molybdopterin-dependent oxidoreductase [Deltaproteobacteria bacterium]MBW2445250.1 molybdopterin-dependent oxidoreductase [Deltaproteobacteria bacterium]
MARALPESHEVVHRSCPLCEAHCGVSVEVDRTSQTVVTIRGDEADPRSGGYLCPKAYGLKGLHEDPDRLRGPQRRVGPRGDPDATWEEIGWDEAFDLVGEQLRAVREAHGPNSIATYIGNPTAHDLGSLVYGQVFQRALGTKWRFSASSVDQLPKMMSSAFLYGNPLGFPVPDIDRTDFLLMLGANPLVSNGSLCTAPDFPGRLAKLRGRGGRLVVVDPRRTETAAIADEHLAIRPGSDAYFLFALANVLFEEGLVSLGPLKAFTNGVEEVQTLAKDFPPEAVEAATGIKAATTRRIARELAATERAVCYGRIGTCTQAFGTLSSWLVDVVNVLSGNVDRPGGAMWPRAASGPGVDPPRAPGPAPYGRWHTHVRGLPEFNGELPVAALAEEIDEAPEAERVHAMVTMAGNPVLSTPNGARLAKAFESLDFMVSVDIYRNETTRFADVILPPTGQLEHSNYEMVFDLMSVRHWSKYSPRVMPKPDDARDASEILSELAGRMAGVGAEVVEQVMLSSLLAEAVGRPGTPCPDVTEAEAREKLGDMPGTDRVLDLLLRAGPHGDRFADASDGLSLERVRAAEHGLDLGPMEPRLPAMLATESGRLELAPPVFVEDVERLRSDLAARSGRDGLVLIGRRNLRSNNSWMHNVEALAKGPERCTLLVHPEDAARLGLVDGATARVRSRVGELTAPVALDAGLLQGVVSLPHGYGHGAPGAQLGVAARHAGVNTNLLTDERDIDVPSGNGVFSGIPVEVAPA